MPENHDNRPIELENLSKKSKAISYIVTNSNQTTHEQNYGYTNQANESAINSETQFRIASMTKSFTAAAALQLRDEKQLELDEPIRNYLPNLKIELPTQDSPEITTFHLLTMTSGLPFCDPWSDRKLNIDNEEFQHILNQGLTLAYPPGLTAKYSSFGYALIGEIIKKISGLTPQQFITDIFLKPLKMTKTTWEHLPNNYAVGYRTDKSHISEPPLSDGKISPMGGLWSTTTDMTKWVRFFLDAYPARDGLDNSPLLRSTRREQQSIASCFIPEVWGEREETQTKFFYGLGLTIELSDLGVQIQHLGGLPGYGSAMCWYPQYDLGMVVLANSTYALTSKILPKIAKKIIETEKLNKRSLVEMSTTNTENIFNQLVQELTYMIENNSESNADIFSENFKQDYSIHKRVSELKQKTENGDYTISYKLTSGTEARLLIQDNKGEVIAEYIAALTPSYPSKIHTLNLINN